MGCASSSAAGGGASDGRDAEADLASKLLEKQLEEQQAEENAIIKLLVLGTGESGKSTVFKQMKILYSVPDPPSKFIMICRANLFGNAHAVMDGMEKLGIQFKSEKAKAAGDELRKVPADGNPNEGRSLSEYPALLKDMYEDAGCVEAIDRAAEYQLNDSTIYFMDRADDLCKPDYMPTEQDVLRARVRTTGIVQQNFAIGEKKYTMFDVGGQRNERRKWIHCFDNVTAVIFVTAISEYDQVRALRRHSKSRVPPPWREWRGLLSWAGEAARDRGRQQAAASRIGTGARLAAGRRGAGARSLRCAGQGAGAGSTFVFLPRGSSAAASGTARPNAATPRGSV